MRGRIPLAVLGAATLTVLAAGPAAAADKDCDDFATQQQAQEYFDANGGSPTNNVDRLDDDHDGIACEALPGGGDSGGDSGGDNGGDNGEAGTGGGSDGEEDELPFTGAGSTWLAAVAAVLLAAGGSLLWRLRHRPSH